MDTRTEDRTLVVERVIKAAPEDVFDAGTRRDEDHLDDTMARVKLHDRY